MKNEITKLKDLKGKLIVDVSSKEDELWLKFSDDTFAVLVIRDIIEGFGHTRTKIALNKYGTYKYNPTVLELALISKEEYEKACIEKDKLDEIYRQEQIKAREDWITKLELEQLEKLKSKYEDT